MNSKDQIIHEEEQVFSQETKINKMGVSTELGETSSQRSHQHSIDRSIQGFFLGPKAQNMDFFLKLVTEGLMSHKTHRNMATTTQEHIDEKIKLNSDYKIALESTQKIHRKLLSNLQNKNIPFHSRRSCGHMKWQISIPSMIGHISTMLYNPNNVAYDGSALSTIIEIQCMKRFAEMIEYPPMIDEVNENAATSNRSWGHFTSGGSVANCEALWAARNMKFFSFSLYCFIEDLPEAMLQKVKNIQAHLVNGTQKNFLDLSVWQLINVTYEETMNLYHKIFFALQGNNFDNYALFKASVLPYTLSMQGFEDFQQLLENMIEKNPNPKWPGNRIPKMKSLVSTSAHYSFNKSVCLLGLGQKHLKKIDVDSDGRVNTSKLEQILNQCAENQRPILCVIGILGSSESSNVDNIAQILEIRKRIAKKGLNFHLHVDGAYGGYFASMVAQQEGKICSISPYTERQLKVLKECDTIIMDPHKTGYAPYQCGVILYKDHRLRFNLNFSAPYMLKKGDLSTSVFGIEGSKSGSSAVSVYMSIEAMPLNRCGHGQLLERTQMNSKIFAACLHTMKDHIFQFNSKKNEQKKNKQRFKCLLISRSYIEKQNCPELFQEQQKAYRKIAQTSVENMYALLEDPIIRKHYLDIGPDLNIVCYAINFIDPQTGTWNKSLKKLNKFNELIIQKTRPQTPESQQFQIDQNGLYLSSTTKLDKCYYKLIQDFQRRHDLVGDGDKYINLIRSAVMNPFFIEQNTQFKNQESQTTQQQTLLEGEEYNIINIRNPERKGSSQGQLKQKKLLKIIIELAQVASEALKEMNLNINIKPSRRNSQMIQFDKVILDKDIPLQKSKTSQLSTEQPNESTQIEISQDVIACKLNQFIQATMNNI